VRQIERGDPRSHRPHPGTGLSTSGGTSDGRFIADICREVVEFGPLNTSIHKLNEHIALENIEQLAAIYQKALEKLLG